VSHYLRLPHTKAVVGWFAKSVYPLFFIYGLQVRALSYIQMNQPTTCSNFTGLLLVVNNELYSLYKEPNLVEDIKIRRLEWAGHIIRMEEERIPKKKF
jgi:hypothetical protein